MNNGYSTLFCHYTKHFSCEKLQTFTHVMYFTKHNGIKFNFKLLPIYLYHETINAVLW